MPAAPLAGATLFVQVECVRGGGHRKFRLLRRVFVKLTIYQGLSE